MLSQVQKLILAQKKNQSTFTSQLFWEGFQLWCKLETPFFVNVNSEWMFKLQSELQTIWQFEAHTFIHSFNFTFSEKKEQHRTKMKFVKIQRLYQTDLMYRQSFLIMNVVWNQFANSTNNYQILTIIQIKKYITLLIKSNEKF